MVEEADPLVVDTPVKFVILPNWWSGLERVEL